jgi:hypothetical protein
MEENFGKVRKISYKINPLTPELNPPRNAA